MSPSTVPAVRTWYINRSTGANRSPSSARRPTWPRAADYDGDGRTDIAVRRDDGKSTWFYILGSRSGFRLVNFGQATDRVVAADYGRRWQGRHRGRAQPRRHPHWYIARSGGGFNTYEFGEQATDQLVPADYDGDHKADVAVWRSGTPGRFYVLRSTGGVSSFAYGQIGDTALAPNPVH